VVAIESNRVKVPWWDVPSRIILVYVSYNIFLPKIGLFGFPVYALELVAVGSIVLFVFSGELKLSKLMVLYFAFAVALLISNIRAAATSGILDTQALLQVARGVIFIMMFEVGRRFSSMYPTKVLQGVINANVTFLVVCTAFVAANIVLTGIQVNELMYGYDARFRVIGFTGMQLTTDFGLVLVGTTSVPMGAFSGFFAVLYLSKFINQRSTWNFLLFSVLSLSCLLTFSRAGLILLLLSIIILLLQRQKYRLLFSLTAMFTVLLILVFSFSTGSILGVFAKFVGSDTELFSDPTRLKIYLGGFDALFSSLSSTLLGVGYGGVYLQDATGYAFLESLFLNTLVGAGPFALVLLLVFFGHMCRLASVNVRVPSDPQGTILMAIRAFIPGWIVQNLVGGNSLNTDFFAPVLFFIFGWAHSTAKDGVRVKTPHARD